MSLPLPATYDPAALGAYRVTVWPAPDGHLLDVADGDGALLVDIRSDGEMTMRVFAALLRLVRRTEDRLARLEATKTDDAPIPMAKLAA